MLPSKINSFVGIYNSQKLHIPLKKAVNASYKRFRAKRTLHKKLVLCWRFIYFIHVNGDARWTSMHTTVKPCKNTAAAYGWTIKLGEPSSFELANGSTSWISVFRLFQALFITSFWLVCHAVKIGSNATDALIEDIRVEELKFQMPSFRIYAEINCRMKV